MKNERSLNAVQGDIDDRYRVSGATRGMGDGPGVLPPVGAITPVEDKGGSRRSFAKPQPAEPQAPPVLSIMKPTIQPAHRR